VVVRLAACHRSLPLDHSPSPNHNPSPNLSLNQLSPRLDLTLTRCAWLLAFAAASGLTDPVRLATLTLTTSLTTSLTPALTPTLTPTLALALALTPSPSPDPDQVWWATAVSPLFTMHVLLNIPATGVAQATRQSVITTLIS